MTQTPEGERAVVEPASIPYKGPDLFEKVLTGLSLGGIFFGFGAVANIATIPAGSFSTGGGPATWPMYGSVIFTLLCLIVEAAYAAGKRAARRTAEKES